MRRFLQRGNLGSVGPSKHVARAVIEPVAVILLVALTAGLDLARPRQSLVFAPKTVDRFAAGIVKTTGQISVKPGVKRGIGADRELEHQRPRMEIRWSRRSSRPHPVIDQTASEMGALDPLGDPRIVFVRNQQ